MGEGGRGIQQGQRRGMEERRVDRILEGYAYIGRQPKKATTKCNLILTVTILIMYATDSESEDIERM